MERAHRGAPTDTCARDSGRLNLQGGEHDFVERSASHGGCALLRTPESLAVARGGDSAAKADDRLTIAVIAKSSTNPVFLAARTGAEAAAKDLSAQHGITIEVQWLTPPQEDGQVQAQRIQQAVNDGADAILISCSDAGKVTGAINDAVDSRRGGDDVRQRRAGLEALCVLRRRRHRRPARSTMAELATLMNGKGKVAILAGNQNAPNLQNRVEGVKQEAAKHPGIEIIGTFNHIETPQDAAAEVMRVNNAYPELQGWAMIGGWPLFTQTLLTDLDPKRIKVVSVDALPPELAYVEKGVVPVLLAQPVYKWGYVGVQTIVDKVHFKKDVPTMIAMELVRVSKENLGEWAKQLQAWGFTDVPERYLKP